MARTSRYAAVVEPVTTTIYNTAVYVRLSVENGHKKDDSSISNQIAMLLQFVEDTPHLKLYSIYEDNGETGVSFDRPEFDRMLKDVRNGLVNCIVVKDLSRFGRNYLEAGEYIENTFPSLGVRFIAVSDGYDSSNPGDIMPLHLKNLANDLYARDISQKIGCVLAEKQKRGDFIGAWAAYGYIKSDENHNKIVIDTEPADVVRNIFHWRLEGASYQNIARSLTEAGVPSPSQYRYNKGILKDHRFKNIRWSIQTIKRILENEVYLGHTVQGRKRESLFEGEKQRRLPKSQWIIAKNTHEPVIEKKIFEAVQHINEQARNRYHTE